MKRRWSTAGALDQVVACPASAVLPQKDEPTDNMIRARKWGHAVHHWIETGNIPDKADGWVKKGLERKLLLSDAASVRDTLWPETGRHEVRIVWDLDDHIEILPRAETEAEDRVWPEMEGSVRIKLDFWSSYETVPMSLRHVTVGEGGPWVDDTKTGREAGTWYHHPLAEVPAGGETRTEGEAVRPAGPHQADGPPEEGKGRKSKG
jgi:hypothetical protein